MKKNKFFVTDFINLIIVLFKKNIFLSEGELFMKNAKLIFFICIVLFIALFLGFSDGTPKGTFTRTGNPVIPDGDTAHGSGSRYANFRYSSDPEVRVYCHDDKSEQVMWIYTSCDIDTGSTSDNYPMDTIYCYSTKDGITWQDWGAMISEKDFPWADVKRHCWAPDSWHYCDTYYLYVPLLQKGSIANLSRIGVAKSTTPHGPFTANPSFIADLGTNGSGGLINNGYASDPGFCWAWDWSPTGGPNLFMTYTNSDWNSHSDSRCDISIARMGDFETAAQDFGPMTISGANNKYKEGSAMYAFMVNISGTATEMYYLIWSAKDNNNDQQQIAYAMATRDDFNGDPTQPGKGPAKCWKYKGNIIEGLPQSNRFYDWTDHASIACITDPGTDRSKDKYYFFYHVGENVKSGNQVSDNRRQMCIAPLSFNDDGTIKKITFSSTQALAKAVQPTVFMKDNQLSNSSLAQPVFSVENNSCYTTFDTFKVKYYFNSENGKTPEIKDVYAPLFNTPTLTSLSSNKWLAEFVYNGAPFKPGDKIPNSRFKICYTDGSTFYKGNDFSQPPSFNTIAVDYVPMFDATGDRIYGIQPTLKDTTSFRNEYSERLLTVANNSDYAQVVCQALNTGWTSQDWIVEPVQGYYNGVRLKNKWSGKYLTVTNTNDYADVVCQPLNTGWTSQVWIMELVDNESGSRRFRNVWSSKYLTVTNQNEGAGIKAQNLNTSWISQQWLIDN